MSKKSKKKLRAAQATQQKPWLLLINPASGGGRSLMTLPKIRAALVQENIPYVESVSNSPQEFLYTVENSQPYCGIAIVGGDSSLVMALPIAARKKIPLAFFASGSQNDIARHLQHYTLYKVAAALKKAPQVVDAFLVTTQKQKQMVAGQVNFGLGVKVNQFVEQLKEQNPIWYSLQFIAGFYGICRTVLSQESPIFMQIKTATHSVAGEFHLALFTKIKYWAGGFLFAPPAELDDGRITAVLVKRCSLWRLLRLLLASRKGKHLTMPEVTLLQAKEFTIEFANPQAAQIDGTIWQSQGQQKYYLFCKPKGYWLHC